MNIVEIIAEDQHASPCKYGNIVDGHACYCHHPDRSRKCPIWRNFGEHDLSKWHNREWPMTEIPLMWWGKDDPRNTYETRPALPDDGIGGCPSFEPPMSA